MKREEIQLRKGRVQIAATDERFPLGARGQRPVKFFLTEDADLETLRNEELPGVLVRGSTVTCAFDAAPLVCDLIEEPGALDAVIQHRKTCAIPIPGKEKYQAGKLFKARYDYQAETARFLFRLAYGVCGEIPRSGKVIMLLIVAELAAARKVLVILNALGKPVYALEVAKWLDEEAVTLHGRGGSEVRRFCAPCRGSGRVQKDDGWQQCERCEGVGERIFVARKLQAVTKARVYFEDTGKLKKDGTPRMQRRVARHTPLPVIFACPKHPEITGKFDEICTTCHAEIYRVIEEARFVLLNYDIIGGHKQTSDAGVETMRDDLTGWGRILARYKFDMAVISEAHYTRGLKQTSEREDRVRSELVEELVDPIERVYAETATLIYGFVRDTFNPLNIVSKGLWT